MPWQNHTNQFLTKLSLSLSLSLFLCLNPLDPVQGACFAKQIFQKLRRLSRQEESWGDPCGRLSLSCQGESGLDGFGSEIEETKRLKSREALLAPSTLRNRIAFFALSALRI